MIDIWYAVLIGWVAASMGFAVGFWFGRRRVFATSGWGRALGVDDRAGTITLANRSDAKSFERGMGVKVSSGTGEM